MPTETDPRVKQDLEILVKAAADTIKGTELSERLEVPYFSLDELIFGSFRGLLDDQVSASRRPAALVRLRKYAGLEPGTKPITELAMAYVRERLATPSCLPPVKAKLQKDLAQASFFVAGVGKLFEKFKISRLRAGLRKAQGSARRLGRVRQVRALAQVPRGLPHAAGTLRLSTRADRHRHSARRACRQGP